jgi:hypothetical protein
VVVVSVSREVSRCVVSIGTGAGGGGGGGAISSAGGGCSASSLRQPPSVIAANVTTIIVQRFIETTPNPFAELNYSPLDANFRAASALQTNGRVKERAETRVRTRNSGRADASKIR